MKRSTVRKIKEAMLGVLFFVLFFGAMGVAGYIENHYTMEGTVDYYKGEKCVIDKMGEAWSDDRVEEYNIGDDVVITFDTNTTDNTRYDDVVTKINLAQ